MMHVQELVDNLRRALQDANTPAEIATLKREHTGKKSPVKLALRGLGKLSPEERKQTAASVQGAMSEMLTLINGRTKQLADQALEAQLAAEWQDATMPGVCQPIGGHHPVSVVERKCLSVLRQLGFEVEQGREVEHPFFNFDALNIPEHHPARDMQDTFWVDDGWLLRSHTTTVQARVLASRREPPFKLASLGRVYRNEAVDATHTAMFHQLEGVWVEPNLTVAHLKGTLAFIAKRLFSDRTIRFKPKFYPYTEPSVGVDTLCSSCAGKGCDACHGAGWVTILGAGMIHPIVFEKMGYDSTKVSGIAFGLGTTRMAAQFAGVNKAKLLYETDKRVFDSIHHGGK